MVILFVQPCYETMTNENNNNKKSLHNFMLETLKGKENHGHLPTLISTKDDTDAPINSCLNRLQKILILKYLGCALSYFPSNVRTTLEYYHY